MHYTIKPKPKNKRVTKKDRRVTSFCRALREGNAQPHPRVDPRVSAFLRHGTHNRIMMLGCLKAEGVRLDAYETLSTIAVMPRVRAAILEAYADDENMVLGDIESLMKNVPIVYAYEPLKGKWGKNRRGRPRKVRISG